MFFYSYLLFCSFGRQIKNKRRFTLRKQREPFYFCLNCLILYIYKLSVDLFLWNCYNKHILFFLFFVHWFASEMLCTRSLFSDLEGSRNFSCITVNGIQIASRNPK